MEPQLPSGSGKKRSESLEEERELRPERGLQPERGYNQKEGNQLYTVEDPILKDGNYQFQNNVGCKTQRASYYSAPKNLYLNYLKKFQNLTSNLKSTFLKHPYLLTSCQVKKKEAEDYLNYTTETYLRYKTEGKMKEAEEKKEKEEEVGRGKEVRKGGRKIKKKGEGRRKRKEKGKEKEDQGNSWRSWTRSGSDRQEGHHGPRSKGRNS